MKKSFIYKFISSFPAYINFFKLLFLFIFIPAIARADDLPVYSAELFYPAENSPTFYSAPDFGRADDKEKGELENKKELFKEARFTFSGMIYGFEFKYVPGDIRRGVDEVFEITPINKIKWGDPRLKAQKIRYEKNRNFVSFLYYPHEEMKSWIMYWSSGSFSVTGGKAEGGFLKGFEAKEDAVKKAVKEAVRAYMRGRIHNKPQMIEGEFVLASPPVYRYAAGVYNASVRIKLNIEKVSTYSVY